MSLILNIILNPLSTDNADSLGQVAAKHEMCSEEQDTFQYLWNLGDHAHNVCAWHAWVATSLLQQFYALHLGWIPVQLFFFSGKYCSCGICGLRDAVFQGRVIFFQFAGCCHRFEADHQLMVHQDRTVDPGEQISSHCPCRKWTTGETFCPPWANCSRRLMSQLEPLFQRLDPTEMAFSRKIVLADSMSRGGKTSAASTVDWTKSLVLLGLGCFCQLWQAIDIDDNGYITRDEFDECLKQEKFMVTWHWTKWSRHNAKPDYGC